jgi:hypothetical protein
MERAHRLKERERLKLHFECHPHLERTDPEGNPIQCGTSVSLYRDLAEEAVGGGAHSYNFISETNAAMARYDYLRTRDIDGTIIVPRYPFEIHPLTKNLEQAISYMDWRTECHKEPRWRNRSGLFDEAPECDGMKKHCGFITAWLHAPISEFTRHEGTGLGTLGPSLRHPIAYASAGHWRTLIDAYRGAAALRLPPWAPTPPPDEDEKGPGTSPGDRAGQEARRDNWSAHRPCPLCQHPRDSIYHAACECQHMDLLYLRRQLRASTGKHISHLSISLDRARRRTPSHPPPPLISPAEETAISQACNTLVNIQNPHTELEARIYTYRLLIAAPWAARNAVEGHNIAKGLGKYFDAIPARYTDNNLIRDTGNLMCSWGDRWLNRIARTRRQAIEDERVAINNNA